MDDVEIHGSHEAVAKRLKRASGHLHNVITMLEDDRECLDVAQQLHAVERAIGGEGMGHIAEGVDMAGEGAIRRHINSPVHHILGIGVARRQTQGLDHPGHRPGIAIGRVVPNPDTHGRADAGFCRRQRQAPWARN